MVGIHHDASNKGSIWRVEARQFSYGNQVIFLIYNRKRISHNKERGEIDWYNETASAFNILFYLFKIHGDKVYIFEKFPHEEIYVAEINGHISLMR
ncbi:TPA: hypothetical protein ACGU2D_003276 [Vibrio vulnificus]